MLTPYSVNRRRHSLYRMTSLTLALLVSAAPASFAAPPESTPVSPAVSPPESLPVSPNFNSSPLEAPYTLDSGDRLKIDIFRIPQYSGEFQVLVDGSLNLPVVGALSVRGMTLAQVETAVVAAYGEILNEPTIAVSLVSARSLQVGIAGEVSQPGSYNLPLDTAQFPTLTHLLETAGGVTQAADLGKIEIHRPQRSGTDQIITVDLWKLVRGGNIQADMALRDGDSIFVPTVATADLAAASEVSSTSFAANRDRPINIAIGGEVYRPGAYTVSSSAAQASVAGQTGSGGGGGGGNSGAAPTLTRAIQTAGGIKPLADIRRIQIRRVTRGGTEQLLEANLLNLLKTADIRQDLILQEGDMIIIPTATEQSIAEASQVAAASFSPDKIRVNLVGEVENPGSLEVPPNTPLNQALLAAGGFTDRARKGEVQLIRLNPNGTVAQQNLPVNFAENVNDQSNPTLQNNDVIVVRRSGIANLSDTLSTTLAPLGSFLSILGFPVRLLNIFR
jgi:polysaccharide biosynthesis/export protein